MVGQWVQYDAGIEWLFEGGSLVAANQLEVALIAQGSDVPTLLTASFLSDFDSGTLLEHQGTGYARRVLSGVSGTPKISQRWRTYGHDPIVYTLLGTSPEPIIGALYYVAGVDDTARIPLSFNDRGGFPKSTTDEDWTLRATDGFYRGASRQALLLPGV